MNTISSVNQNTTNQAQQSNQVATSTTTSAADSDQNESSNSSNIALSDRAQKIQKLNEEFFPNGPRSVKITPDFIKRLEEYGFLKPDQATSLLASPATSGEDDQGTVGELADFASEQSAERTKTDPEDSLAAILSKASSILNNLDGSTPSKSAEDIGTVYAELQQYLKSDDASTHDDETVAKLEQVSDALRIADSLQPENRSSEKVNSYLKILSGI